MAQLHETMYGKRLLEHDIPEINKSLRMIADELKRANDLKEKESK